MKIRQKILQTISIVAFLTLWEITVDIFHISEIILPSPLTIGVEIFRSFTYLCKHSTITATETILGFLIGLLSALLTGTIIALSKDASALLSPHIAISQAIPKGALAPLLVIWLGYGIEPKIVVAAISSFLPLATAVIHGLTEVNSGLLELFNGFGATKLETLIKLRIPTAIPYISASLQMSLLYSLLGATTAELVNADKGIGYVLMASETNLNTPLLFAALICVCTFGLFISFIANTIDKFVRFKMRTDFHAHE